MSGELFFSLFSSEVCPFCGKTYKRLKSHLPHCKAAAASADPPPTSHEGVGVRGSSLLSSLKEEKPRGAEPAASKKKKQKLSEQIKAALSPPSTAAPPTSQPRSLHPTASKVKKTTSSEFVQAAGPQKVVQGAPKRSREEPSAAQRVEPTKTSSEEGFCPPAPPAAPAPPPTGDQGSSQRKASKKKATRALLSQTDEAERTAGARGRNHEWATTERKVGDVCVGVDSGNGPRSKITLQDVKAALGRDRKPLKASRPSVLDHIEAPDPSSRVAPSAALTPAWLPERALGAASTSRLHASPPLAPASLTPLPPRVTGLSTLLPASVETPGAREGLRKDETHLEDRTEGRSERKEPTPRRYVHAASVELFFVLLCAVGVLAQRRLAQVRLKELPDWLACKTPTNPRDLAKMVQQGECSPFTG